MFAFSFTRLKEAQQKLRLKEEFKPDESNWNEYQNFIHSAYLDTISYRSNAGINTNKIESHNAAAE